MLDCVFPVCRSHAERSPGAGEAVLGGEAHGSGRAEDDVWARAGVATATAVSREDTAAPPQQQRAPCVPDAHAARQAATVDGGAVSGVMKDIYLARVASIIHNLILIRYTPWYEHMEAKCTPGISYTVRSMESVKCVKPQRDFWDADSVWVSQVYQWVMTISSSSSSLRVAIRSRQWGGIWSTIKSRDVTHSFLLQVSFESGLHRPTISVEVHCGIQTVQSNTTTIPKRYWNLSRMAACTHS